MPMSLIKIRLSFASFCGAGLVPGELVVQGMRFSSTSRGRYLFNDGRTGDSDDDQAGQIRWHWDVRADTMFTYSFTKGGEKTSNLSRMVSDAGIAAQGAQVSLYGHSLVTTPSGRCSAKACRGTATSLTPTHSHSYPPPAAPAPKLWGGGHSHM